MPLRAAERARAKVKTAAAAEVTRNKTNCMFFYFSLAQ